LQPAWVWSFRRSRRVSPATWVATFASAFRVRQSLRELLSTPPRGIGHRLRQFKALGHAVALAAQLRQAGLQSVHFHAHFLGRTLDVLTYARALHGGETHASATGHAADATAPSAPRRLRAELDKLDFVVCTSDSVSSGLIAAVGPVARRLTIRTGVEERPVVEPILSRVVPLRICSIGRLVEKKGFRDCVSAGYELRDHGMNFHWTMIGDGPLRTDLQTSSIDLGQFMTWRGHMENRDVLEFLSSSVDVLVQPCRPASDGDIDGVPVVLIEAMSMGIPVVTTRVSGIPELVEGVGDLCEAGDYAGIAERLLAIDRDREAARQRGIVGRDRVNDAFNDRRETSKLLAAIDHAWEAEAARRPTEDSASLQTA
jgi:colanic acid/amylovoran biosynthesis glycosyltransferase